MTNQITVWFIWRTKVKERITSTYLGTMLYYSSILTSQLLEILLAQSGCHQTLSLCEGAGSYPGLKGVLVGVGDK